MSEKAIDLNNGRKGSPIAGITIGALTGIVLALLFFVVCWLLVDAFVPVVAGRLLSANVWTNSGHFSLSHFDYVIGACGLGSAVADRVIVLAGAAIYFAFVTGNWVRKGIVGEGGSILLPSLIQMGFLLPVVLALTMSLAMYRPPANAQVSATCISEKNAPNF